MKAKQLTVPAKRRSGAGTLDQGALPGLLGYRLRLAQQVVFSDFAASVQGLSPGRIGLLILIDANPGVAQSRLAEAARRDRSTMVGALDQLEGRGLLERRRGVDRRSNGLWLTRPGRAFLARALRSIAAHERRIATRLSVAERRQLLALLGRIAG
ncbi:MAG: MarR family winged helix-turn-helix transcriptional regulator [Burkholderiales bacterium]